ncbi:MAG: hypothetical protein PHF80_02720 [Methanothrix sp.]|nr:hypothetical protein [Methanothrix sp.]
MTRTVSFWGDATSSLARSDRDELSDKTFFLFVSISTPEFSRGTIPEPSFASAANVWLTDWLSEIAKASDTAAELPRSAEKPSEETNANKKNIKTIIIVVFLKIFIPPNY